MTAERADSSFAGSFASRLAEMQDVPRLRELMHAAISDMGAFLDAQQIEASFAIMGLDTQLILDKTYFLIEQQGHIVGCGGWSRRATLYGGDHSAPLRDATQLDPARDAARVRAMYTDPRFARRGIGRRILALCEQAARAEGFRRVELMATLPGEPLYRACGYLEMERTAAQVGDVRVPLVRMGKAL